MKLNNNQNHIRITIDDDIERIFDTQFRKNVISKFKKSVSDLNRFIDDTWYNLPNNIQYQFFKNDSIAYREWMQSLSNTDLDDILRIVKNKNYELLEYKLTDLTKTVEFVEFFAIASEEPCIAYNTAYWTLLGGFDKKQVNEVKKSFFDRDYEIVNEFKLSKVQVYLLSRI